ncbi:hypothetical protein ACSIGC_07620 [Tenacibaculum sp. ZS6-P6]|uniref:hypothetical protein n=1 Tax=Tenacibaculum sp. ZS6-P6 TaxID=3447503 RepID=UPI003F97CBA8
MKAFKSLISITIYLFFTVGVLPIINVAIEEMKNGNACPKISNFPLCYIILILFLIALISHITNKMKFIYFTSIGIAFIIATIVSILHMKGDFVCPRTFIKGTPKCYYAVGLLFSLIFLKILHIRDIEKDLMKT